MKGMKNEGNLRKPKGKSAQRAEGRQKDVRMRVVAVVGVVENGVDIWALGRLVFASVKRCAMEL